MKLSNWRRLKRAFNDSLKLNWINHISTAIQLNFLLSLKWIMLATRSDTNKKKTLRTNFWFLISKEISKFNLNKKKSMKEKTMKKMYSINLFAFTLKLLLVILWPIIPSAIQIKRILKKTHVFFLKTNLHFENTLARCWLLWENHCFHIF